MLIIFNNFFKKFMKYISYVFPATDNLKKVYLEGKTTITTG